MAVAGPHSTQDPSKPPVAPLQTYTEMASIPLGFNIDIPRWDQSTFMGRLKHFFNVTDPRTVLVLEKELDQAKAVVESCR